MTRGEVPSMGASEDVKLTSSSPASFLFPPVVPSDLVKYQTQHCCSQSTGSGKITASHVEKIPAGLPSEGESGEGQGRQQERTEGSSRD